MRINAIVLFVKDLPLCQEFYEKKLGLNVKNTDEGFVAFELEGNQELALMSLNEASKMIDDRHISPSEEGVHRALLAMYVEDTDLFYKKLVEEGVEFIKEPSTQPWGQRTAYFKDPEDNIWEISHFLSEE